MCWIFGPLIKLNHSKTQKLKVCAKFKFEWADDSTSNSRKKVKGGEPNENFSLGHGVDYMLTHSSHKEKAPPTHWGRIFSQKRLKPKFILKLLACCQWKANNTLNANNGHVHLILLFFCRKCTTLWRFGSQQTANLWMSNLFPSFFKNN